MIPKTRYYFWIEDSLGVHQLGKMEGYDSVEELKRDRKYDIKRQKKHNKPYWILKADILEEIK